jgi:hypothetical protein
VNYNSKKLFSCQKVLFNLVEETKYKYVLPKLKECYFATTNFDLWSKGTHDGLALVISSLVMDGQPKHITIGLFKASATTG